MMQRGRHLKLIAFVALCSSSIRSCTFGMPHTSFQATAFYYSTLGESRFPII
jgi:hypothetical protein